MTLASDTCFSGLPLNSNGAYAVEVVRVYLAPFEDDYCDPTSVLVELDDSLGWGLGEEEAVKVAVDFADRMSRAGDPEHLGWINYRDEDEGPEVEVVLSPLSPAGPRAGERALILGEEARAARDAKILEVHDLVRGLRI
jgi:hypothetical protein